MPVSTPMKLIAFRIPADERERLEQLAAERHVTLSDAFREGLRLYLDDARRHVPSRCLDPSP